MPEHFGVRTDHDGASAVVRLDGELDMSGTFLLEPALDQLVARPPDGEVLFDLRGLRFLDSTGLGTLVAAHERLRRDGVTTRFIRGNDDIQRIFTIAGFDGVLEFTDVAP